MELMKSIRIVYLILIVFATVFFICYNINKKGSLLISELYGYSVKSPGNETSFESTKPLGENFYKIEKSDDFIDSEIVSRREGLPSEHRRRATMVAIVKKRADIALLPKTIKNYQERFNDKYNYDWIIITFRGIFIDDYEGLLSLTKSPTRLRIVSLKYSSEILTYRPGTDVSKMRSYRSSLKVSKKLKDQITTASKHFTRFASGHFYNLDSLWSDYDYYWKVPIASELSCDVNYDVFEYMENNDIKYGWSIIDKDPPAYHPSLLQCVKNYVYNAENNFSENSASTVSNTNFQLLLHDDVVDAATRNKDVDWKYKSCSYNSDFELVNVKFFKSKQYKHFFNYLDSFNGIYYENWREQAIKTIATSLFLDSKQVKFFDDLAVSLPNLGIGNCPSNPKLYLSNKCICNPLRHLTPFKYGKINMKYQVLSQTQCFAHYFNSLDLEIPKSFQAFERDLDLFKAFANA